MSEADTPNNPPVPEPIDIQSTDASDPPQASAQQPVDSDLTPPPAMAAQNFRQLLSSTELPVPATAQSEKESSWFAVVQKLRQRNRQLLTQVTQLEQLLSECNAELQVQAAHFQERELLIAQQNLELETAQSQVSRLFHELESSHQAAQRQQILVETLSEQLEGTQERIAQMERECALTQQHYDEQSHQLLQSANTCRELRTRLHRQQRQTLQFKAALEKCLEVSPPLSEASPAPSHANILPLVQSLPKAPPIQPWSADPDFLDDADDFAPHESDLSLPESPATNTATEFDNFDASSSEEEFYYASTAKEPELTAFDGSLAAEQEWEQQLLAEMSSLAAASGITHDPDLSLYPPTSRDLPFSDGEETPLSELLAENDLESEYEDEDFLDDESAYSQDSMLYQSNWPSPVVYPLRPPKKRPSLAAIELPSFPPRHQQP
jgi:hypothetical protein